MSARTDTEGLKGLLDKKDKPGQAHWANELQ